MYDIVWYVENSLCLSQCVLMCATGVPLTPSNVMRVASEVEEWWGDGYDGEMAGQLFIPDSKQEEIRQMFPGEMEQKKQSISYWINMDPLASWRRLITRLDWMRQFRVADSIRHNAEPLTGSHKFVFYILTFALWYGTCHYHVQYRPKKSFHYAAGYCSTGSYAYTTIAAYF